MCRRDLFSHMTGRIENTSTRNQSGRIIPQSVNVPPRPVVATAYQSKPNLLTRLFLVNQLRWPIVLILECQNHPTSRPATQNGSSATKRKPPKLMHPRSELASSVWYTVPLS